MKKLTTIGLVFLLLWQVGYSNELDKANKKGDLIGTVIDATNKVSIEYSTVALYTSDDNKLITGGITDSEGFFRFKHIQPGKYYLTVTFMGYSTQTIPNISITKETKELDLGDILLKTNSKEIEGVDVIADQSSVQYKIDKKVVNVSQQLTAISGSAVDVLANVPSVKVDIEGNVSLRGSGEFTVLIDGRPTVLDPSDALSQIPAGAIENIEIITNPSAKFEPDGSAGIVNIVTKKNKLNGFSGVINANGGTNDRYGADATFDVRKEKIHYYLGADYSNRGMNGISDNNQWTRLSDDTTLYLSSNGDWNRGRQRYSARAGFDFNLSENDVIGIGGRAGTYGNERSSLLNYYEWLTPVNDSIEYLTNNLSNRDGNYFSVNVDYKHTFNENTDHFLEIQANIDGRNGDETSKNYSSLSDGEIFEGKLTTESGPSSGYRFKADYAQPLVWGGKFEAGGQVQISNSEDNNTVSDYDTVQNDFVLQPQYNTNTTYTRNTYAAYGILGGELGDFGFQGGLRTEYTYRLLETKTTDESYVIDRPDFFPTVHLSYNLPADQQTMFSYTRRIVRPRGHWLEPFVSWSDANNVRQGNPALEPEYVNSLDLSYQKKFGKGRQKHFVSFEGYYRITQNKVERVTYPWELDRNIMMNTYANIGTDYALGLEAMLNYSPTKWYSFNLMTDFYDYRLQVDYLDNQYEQHNFSWSSRFNNTFKVTPTTRVQLDVNYESERVRAQGTQAGFFSSSLAVKQDFFKRKLSAIIQVRDIFGTWQRENELSGPDFYQYQLYQPNTPMFMATVSYKLNNYKTKRGGRSDGESMGGDEDGGF